MPKGNLMRVARIAAYEQSLQVASVRQLLTSIANFPSVVDHDADKCGAVFADLVEPQPHYMLLGAVDLDGDIWCSGSPITARVNITDRPYFQRALESNDFSEGEYQIGRITHKPSINFAYPIHDSSRRTTGVVFAALDITWINRLAARVPQPAGGTIVVIDSTGMVVAHRPNHDNRVGSLLADAALRSTILSSKQARITSVTTSNGVAHLVAIIPLLTGTVGTSVAVYMPESLALADARDALARDLTILATVTLLILAVAWYGGNFFVLRQIRTLVSAAGGRATRQRRSDDTHTATARRR